MPTNTRTDSYDFKSAKEGALTVEYTGMAVTLDGNGYVSSVECVEDAKTVYKMHFTNYSLIYAGLSYGTDRTGNKSGIYMYEVVGSGSEYKPKFTIECNGTLLHNDDPWLNVKRERIEANRYNDKVWRQKFQNEIDIADLNDWETRFNNAIGGGIDVYEFFPPVTQFAPVASRIEITDVVGEGIAIVPYGLYDFYTVEDYRDITFTDIETAVYNQSFDYIGSKYSQVENIPNWYMPHNRMSADTEGLFSWYYPTSFYTFNLHGRADYLPEDINYWQDYSDIDGLGLLMQCVYGLNMEQLHLGDKRFHKFKGIQWDVWLDGKGQSMGITIIPTYLGGVETEKKCYCQFGFEDLGSGPGSNVGIGTRFSDKYITLTNGQTYNTTFIELENLVGFPIPPGGVSDIIVRWFYDPIPTSEQEWHWWAFSNNIPQMGIEEENDPIIKIGSGTGYFTNDLPILLKDDSVSYWHVGAPPNSDDYDDSNEDSDKIDEGEGYNGIGILTKQYALTTARTQALGWQLWEAGFFDNIHKINNSPMENIISVKALPFNVPGNDEEIVLGNVPMNVNGEKITSFNSKMLIGSINVTGIYNSFLDFAPFTKITIFLPFIGFKDLDVSAIMYKTLTVYYITDILTGACRAELRVDNVPFVCFDGDIGIDISLAASNRAQVEAAFITSAASNIVSGVSSAAGGDAAGVAKSVIGLAESAQNQYHTTNSGAPSPACSAYQTRDVYLIYDRPTYQDLKVFNHTHGRMCMLSRSLGTLSGYTETSPEIDLSGVPCLQEEAEQLISILSGGFFVT